MVVKEIVPDEEDGLLLGEIRTICVNFRDLDLLESECGDQAPNCPPANHHSEKKICDRVVPDWKIVANPEPERGDGVFLWPIGWPMGRVALFRATKAGPVEIKVEVQREELPEKPSVTIPFPIRQLNVRSLSFANHHGVLMDAANGDGLGSPARFPYSAPHWFDKNLDGEATEAGDVLDRRFPVCYSRGQKLAIQRVEFAEPSMSVPEYPIVARAKCSFGDAPSQSTLFQLTLTPTGPVGGRYFVAQFSAGDELESAIPFPNSIQLYDPLVIEWDVSFSNDLYSWAGETDNFAYIVMGAEIGNQPKAQPIESVLYVSCRAADHGHEESQASADLVFQRIYARFRSLQLKCKPYHGNNVIDDRELGYHLNGAAVPNGNVASNRNLLLASLGPPITNLGRASGSCGAFAQLLMSCAGVHGINNTTRLRVLPSFDDALIAWGAAALTGTSGDPEYPLRFLGEEPSADEVVLQPNPAQGNPTPIQWFDDHDIVRYLGQFYDPSYGLPVQSSFALWEWLALWGFTLDDNAPTFARVHDGSVFFEDTFTLPFQW